jgi:hypothetical protein
MKIDHENRFYFTLGIVHHASSPSLRRLQLTFRVRRFPTAICLGCRRILASFVQVTTLEAENNLSQKRPQQMRFHTSFKS